MGQLFSCLPVRFSASSTKFTEIKSTTLQIETFISKGFFKIWNNFFTPKFLFAGGRRGANFNFCKIYQPHPVVKTPLTYAVLNFVQSSSLLIWLLTSSMPKRV